MYLYVESHVVMPNPTNGHWQYQLLEHVSKGYFAASFASLSGNLHGWASNMAKRGSAFELSLREAFSRGVSVISTFGPLPKLSCDL